MKINYVKIAFVFFVFEFFIFSYPLKTEAMILLPFGGKVSSLQFEIACPEGKTPFTIKPALSSFPLGPYSILWSVSSFSQNVSPGVWVIGLYSTIPMACVIPPNEPVLVFPVFLIGTSRMPSL